MKALHGVEAELKYGLTRQEYDILYKAHCKMALSQERHINFYFDDKHLNLRRVHIGLRIRQINTRKMVLTLKYPKSGVRSEIRAFKVRSEFEAPLSVKCAQKIISGEKDILSLKCYPIRKLFRVYPIHTLCEVVPLGSIRTHRLKASLNHKFTMELDKSQMFGKTFYELEVETNRPKKADRAIHNLFWKYGITYQPVRRSKLARFIEEWRKRQK